MKRLLTGDFHKRLSIRLKTKVPLRMALRASKGCSYNNMSYQNFKTLSQIHLLAQTEDSKPSVTIHLNAAANHETLHYLA